MASVWDWLSALHSSRYGTVFQICDWNDVDRSPIFHLLLSRACAESSWTFPPLCQKVGLGWARNWKETQAGLQTKLTNSDILCVMMPCSARKAHGKKKRRKFGVMAFDFPRNHYLWWRSAFEEVAKHLSANGSSEVIPYFALFMCTDFTSPTKYLYHNLQVFSYSFYFLPLHGEESEQTALWVLGCWLGSYCNNGNL